MRVSRQTRVKVSSSLFSPGFKLSWSLLSRYCSCTYILVTRESLTLASDQAAFILTIILASVMAVSTALAVSATNSTSSLRHGYRTNTPRARIDDALMKKQRKKGCVSQMCASVFSIQGNCVCLTQQLGVEPGVSNVREDFNWVSKLKVIRNCFGFTLCDWFKKLAPATYPTNQMQNQTQSQLGCTRFPALSAGYMYLLWVFIGLHLLWLAIVIALVLVLWHSIENHSI